MSIAIPLLPLLALVACCMVNFTLIFTSLTLKLHIEGVFIDKITAFGALKSIGDMLKGPCNLSRDFHNRKMGGRK
jgi:hypothetical protein